MKDGFFKQRVLRELEAVRVLRVEFAKIGRRVAALEKAGPIEATLEVGRGRFFSVRSRAAFAAFLREALPSAYSVTNIAFVAERLTARVDSPTTFYVVDALDLSVYPTEGEKAEEAEKLSILLRAVYDYRYGEGGIGGKL